MTKILALLILISCNITVTRNKLPSTQEAASADKQKEAIPEKEIKIEPTDKKNDQSEASNPVIDLNNIDLPAMVSNPLNVIFARGLYEEFVKRIKVSAEERNLDISAVEWDNVFDKIIEACKSVEAKKFVEIIDELDPKIMAVIKNDPGLSAAANITFIESHKDDFLKLLKVLGPSLIKSGLGSLAVAEFYSQIP